MCSAWDEGTYEVRFERKQCRLFCFFFFNIFIILHCLECLLPQYAPSLGNEQRSRILSGLYGEFKPFALAHLILGL